MTPCNFARVRYLEEPKDGQLFYATTVNGFANESFDNNLYFLTGSTQSPKFPCVAQSAKTLEDKDVEALTNCSLADWQSSGHDLHSLVGQDPLFLNAQARNFELHSDSPALQLGIVSIDTSTVGPIPESV